jgi:ATP-GRASP peptide maturase of grasp-with-spasm system
MILILSQDAVEPTTEDVCDWIAALGGTCVRLNGEDLNGDDLNGGEPFAMRYDAAGAGMRLRLGGREVRPDDVRVVWLRRWHTYRNLAFVDAVGDAALAREMQAHLVGELRAVTGSLELLLRHARWLSAPGEHALNKLRALHAAARAGLTVPATLVTNDRAELRAFAARHGRVIVKPAGDGRAFVHRDVAYPMYTAELTPRDVDGAPDRFFPTLVQERLEKAYEVRTFVLDDACHSMAIFSQADERTRADFRRYDDRRPNRTVPYRLPEDVERGIRALTRDLALSTGSLDFVRTPDGRHVFVEVNPAGQFGMVSAPCNYRLEKRVAEYLIRSDADVR